MATPARYAQLMDALGRIETPNLESIDSETVELFEEVMAGGARDDGSEWANALLLAIDVSCDYGDVSEDVYEGTRMVLWEDDEGPLADGWNDEPYSLIDRVIEALLAASDDKPPQWGEVLLAASKRFRGCGVDFEQAIEAAKEASDSELPQYPQVRGLIAAIRGEFPDLMIDLRDLP
jgi:hypothetical protein